MSHARAELASPWRIVEAATVAPVAWRNGGGVTRELLRLTADAALAEPVANEDWVLRISVADIATDGPFSRFPGVLRSFAVIAGAGVVLDWGDGRRAEATPGSEPVDFNGDDAPDCRLLDGPTRDLNVMVRGDLASSCLRRAAWNEPWTPRAPQAGMYARVPLQLTTASGCVRQLKAQTLAWCDHVDAPAWSIAATSSTATLDGPAGTCEAPPGWWIALSPVPPPRRLHSP
ncbi:MAG TPA: HutD family protein [Burkholderiaceae bacterium]|jgi:hypothetical protein|nr:HutD family protein [Burkholderiaceae bacterium]